MNRDALAAVPAFKLTEGRLTEDELIAIYREGKTTAQLRKQYGISLHTADEWLVHAKAKSQKRADFWRNGDCES